ncbi:MAG: tail fiber domain-containing protein [Bacteroidales bacterium]|nr:tail fiber domain-containing protein [Bacteroidales bacterium]
MKIQKIILLAMFLTVSVFAKSQDKMPDTFNYQAVINDDEGKPVAGKEITVEVTVLQGETEKYKELHNTVTSELGLFSVEIGSGTQISAGNYSEINWLDVSGGFYYLQVKADFGKSEFLNGMNDLGKTKFSAVPYALAAKTAVSAQTAEKVTNAKLSDLTDVDVESAVDGQVLTLDGGKWVAKTVSSAGPSADKLSLLSDVTLTSAEVGQVLSFDGSKWVNKTIEAKTALSELTDVTISNNLADGHVLKYDGKNKKWINAAEGDMWKKWDKGIYTTQRVEIGKSTSTTPFTDDVKFLLEISQSDGQGILFKENEIFMKGGSIVIGGSSKAEKYINIPYGCFAVYGEVDNDHNVAFGENGAKSIVSGSTGSIAFGQSCNITSSNNAAAFGRSIKIQSADFQFACGRFNAVAKNDGTNPYPLFIVGNGTKEDARSNAFCVNSNGTATLAGELTSSSDSRLKNNVTTIGSALDKVTKLRGVTFNWDLAKKPSADKKLQYGFIAQEVEKVFPELVTTDSEGFKSLNYIGIVPVLTEAVKELKKENDELKNTIQDLVKRIEALEKK